MIYFLWFLIVSVVHTAGYIYIGRRVIPSLNLPRSTNRKIWTGLIVLLLFSSLFFFLQIQQIEGWWVDVCSWIMYTGMGFMSFVVTFLLIRDTGWFLAVIGKWPFVFLKRIFSSNEISKAPENSERRRFIIRSMNVGILGLSGALTGYGIFEARRKPAIVEMTVPIQNLHNDLQGLRIVQLTDIHAGLTVGRAFVETIVQQTNELSPDIIVFTGDLVDGSVARLRKEVAPMANLKAPYGRYFITGNHEYYSDVIPWVEEVKRLGFDVLLNEHRVIERGSGRLLMAGVTDFSGGQFFPKHVSSPEAAMAGAPKCDASIFLAHQPKSLFAALPYGFDLMISGHTHGGQFFPWNIFAAMGQPYIDGMHKHENMLVYVSRGTGYWGPPVRIAARSEITLFTLASTETVNHAL